MGTSRAVRTASVSVSVTASRPTVDPRTYASNGAPGGLTTPLPATIAVAVIRGVGAAAVGISLICIGGSGITSTRGSPSRGRVGAVSATPVARPAIRGTGKVVRCPCPASLISGSCRCPVAASRPPAGCRKVTGRRSGRLPTPRPIGAPPISRPTAAVTGATVAASRV